MCACVCVCYILCAGARHVGSFFSPEHVKPAVLQRRAARVSKVSAQERGGATGRVCQDRAGNRVMDTNASTPNSQGSAVNSNKHSSMHTVNTRKPTPTNTCMNQNSLTSHNLLGVETCNQPVSRQTTGFAVNCRFMWVVQSREEILLKWRPVCIMKVVYVEVGRRISSVSTVQNT